MNNIKKNVIWNTLGLTLNSFNSLFFLVIVNRVNGVEMAGVFSFAFSIACLLYIIGIYAGRTFQVSDAKQELSDKEYLMHKYITCAVMLAFGIVFVILQKYSQQKNTVIILLCIYKCLEAFDDTLYGYLQKNEQLHIVGKSLFFKSIVGIVVFWGIDLISRNLIIACCALIINSLCFVIFYDIKKSIIYMKTTTVSLKCVLKLFKIGFPVFAFSFLSVYIVNIPKYVMDIFLEDSFQTVFGIIVMPGTVMSLCGQYITAPLLNNFVNCFNSNQYEKLKRMSNKIIIILLAIGLLVEVIAAFLGIPILSFVYSLDLKLYNRDLLFIIGGAMLYAIGGIYSTILITMRKNKMQLAIYVIDAIVGMTVCYLMIPIWKVHGATIGYVATMIVHVVLYKVYFKIVYRQWKLSVSEKIICNEKKKGEAYKAI